MVFVGIMTVRCEAVLAEMHPVCTGGVLVDDGTTLHGACMNATCKVEALQVQPRALHVGG